MNKPKISVIVPVYKAERYLQKCVDSLLTQTFQDYEILLIDDGSPDCSGEICDEYAKKDFRVRVFHKENGGVSSARNVGIDSALGEWITFVDADDFISLTFLEGLYKPISLNTDIDFVQGGCTNWSNEKVVGINQSYEDYVGEDSVYLFQKFRGLTVSKLFRLEIIKRWSDGLGLRFDEKMKIAEDMAFTLDYIIMVKRYAFVSEMEYYYRKDNLNSATHSCNYDYSIGLHEFKHQYESTINYIRKKRINMEDSEYRLGLMGRELFDKQQILYKGGYSYKECYSHIVEDFTDDQRKLFKYWTFSGWQYPLAKLEHKGFLRLFNFLMFFIFRCYRLLKSRIN